MRTQRISEPGGAQVWKIEGKNVTFFREDPGGLRMFRKCSESILMVDPSLVMLRQLPQLLLAPEIEELSGGGRGEAG